MMTIRWDNLFVYLSSHHVAIKATTQRTGAYRSCKENWIRVSIYSDQHSGWRSYFDPRPTWYICRIMVLSARREVRVSSCLTIPVKLTCLALRILNHLQFNTARLDVSHNLLGTGGVMTLVKGLAHVRQRYSSDTSRIWTLSEINLAFNALGDEGLESVLGWAKKDLGCRKLLLQGNDIKVSSTITRICPSADE